ncbi:hypothetical protein KRR55_17890 [Paeniglutamicibacter sp. ABSL32-1]|uniref:hypothetical protein n=1 Tax=Paeniglutamicibacter quisquiliarum TaxID=2849498 RepID=UPI001C2CC9B8|nr:hypothetical protein [Paeniglutamicibacter quisquiliarum]MBV1780988.1 hypothetical protein [Paeniglutamicibacter quisquiliarum]
MNEKKRLYLVLGFGCLLTSVVAVVVTAISLFARFREFEDLGHVLDGETFSRIVGMTAADTYIVVSGAALFAAGVVFIIAGSLRRNAPTA